MDARVKGPLVRAGLGADRLGVRVRVEAAVPGPLSALDLAAVDALDAHERSVCVARLEEEALEGDRRLLAGARDRVER
jgi:hypothetical protein